MSLGGEASIRFGISNNLMIQLKGWKDISNNLSIPRYGFSFSTLTVLNDTSDFRFGLFPTAAFVLSENDIEGGGGSIPLCLWYTKYYPITFYSAFGPAIGIRNITNDNNQWGWGLIFNLGTAIIIEDHLTVNLEISGIKQVNENNGYKSYFFSPSLNIGYLF